VKALLNRQEEKIYTRLLSEFGDSLASTTAVSTSTEPYRKPSFSKVRTYKAILKFRHSASLTGNKNTANHHSIHSTPFSDGRLTPPLSATINRDPPARPSHFKRETLGLPRNHLWLPVFNTLAELVDQFRPGACLSSFRAELFPHRSTQIQTCSVFWHSVSGDGSGWSFGKHIPLLSVRPA